MNQAYGKKRSHPVKNVFLLFIGAAILIFALFNFIRSYQQNYRINDEIVNLSAQIDELQRANDEQKKMIEYFNSSAYIEDRARSSLGLKKEGENVVIANNPAQDLINNQGGETGTTAAPLSNPQKWWHYFFK